MAAKPLTVLVTGVRGKVGVHVAAALKARGHTVIGTDVVRGVYDAPLPSDPLAAYTCADLTDAGAAFAVIGQFRPDAVIHIAAIPDPTHEPAHVVFTRNTAMTFNVVEACVRFGVPRLVNVSSETAPGFFFDASSPSTVPVKQEPRYCPVDELHPCTPNDPYALSKLTGEMLCDAAARRGLPVISIRPSWCQDSRNIERNLGPLIRDHAIPQAGMWSYIIISDLAAAMALAAESAVPGHEVVYIAADDNIGSRDLAAAVAAGYGGRVPVRPLPRPDASGLDCAKAKRLLGWAPKHGWRDFLTADGHLRPAAELPALPYGA